MLQKITERYAAYFFWSLILLSLVDRLLLVHSFGITRTSNDDIIFWLGAHDYARGVFHEPFMYGQDYNYMAESLLAVPFVWMGVPYHILMPLVTSFMALMPFWVFARDQYRKKNLAGALLIAAIPLLLPAEYGIMTTVTRGFVNGIFFLSFFPLAARIQREQLRFFFMAASCAAACIVNPNALVLAVPLLLLAWTEHLRKLRFYIFSVLGALPFLVFYLLSRHYYVVHPEIVVHSLHGGWRMDFHGSELIPEALKNLDRMFRYLGIGWWKNGSMLPIFLVLVMLLLFLRRHYRQALALLSGLLVILIAFGYPKVHDGFETPFYSFSRNFLAAPLLAGIAIAFLLQASKYRQVFTAFVCLAALGFFTFKCMHMEQECNRIADQKLGKDVPLTVVRVAEVKKLAARFDSIAQVHHVNLITCIDGPEMDVAQGQFLCIGGELLHQNFPATYMPQYERRSWLKAETENTIYSTILFTGGEPSLREQFMQKHPDVLLLAQHPEIYILKNNTRPFHEVWAELFPAVQGK